VSSRSALIVIAAVYVAAGLVFLSPAYIRPDSVATFAYLRSAVFDGDFAFFNEWAMTGMVRQGVTYFAEVTPVGALANHWWIGTSILSAPTYLATRVFGGDGFLGQFAVTLAWTNVAFAVLATWMAWKLTRSAHAVIAAIIGTPFFWYTFRFPLGTHIAGALCVAVILFAEDEVLIGLATGLAIATRLQHFMLIPAAIFLLRKRRVTWRVVAAFLIPIACQAAAWQAIYGTPFGPLTRGASLAGTTWMPFQHLAFVPVLFSTYHGVFTWSPIIAVAIAGWLLGLREHRQLAIALLLMFTGELIANATFDRYFWGGMSFGPRRFVDLFVPFAIGMAWFAQRVPRWIAYTIEILCCAWSVMLMAAAASDALSLSRYVSNLFVMPRSFALHPAPLGQSLIAIVIVAIVFAIAWRVRHPATAMSAVFAIVIVIALRTPRTPPPYIDVVRSRNFGPLIDERGLLADEVAWARATGDDARASATQREIQQIDAIVGR
jgi:hypothetical protein